MPYKEMQKSGTLLLCAELDGSLFGVTCYNILIILLNSFDVYVEFILVMKR